MYKVYNLYDDDLHIHIHTFNLPVITDTYLSEFALFAKFVHTKEIWLHLCFALSECI